VSGGTVPAVAGVVGPPPGPETVLVGGGVLAAAAVAGILLFVRLRPGRTPAHRLRAALAVSDEVAVLTHPNPDPDALASALTVRDLAEAVDTPVTIYYPGEIRHEENLALVSELGIEATRLRDASDLAGRDVVLVDHNQARGFAGAGGISPYAVVDHHPGDGEGAAFTDVRSSYGACASLMAEYLQELGWRTDPQADGKVVSESVATALVYGIRSDTAGFTRGCTAAEFDAAAYCSERADPDTIERVGSPPMSPKTMEVRARTVLDRVERGAFACTHAGTVPSPDAVAQAADDLLRMDGLRAVVVAGQCDGTLHLSGRAAEGSVDVGEVLSRAIEGIPMADAGGHARMGGGQLSIEHMDGLGPGEGVSVEQFFESVFAVMASQDPEGAPDHATEPVEVDRMAVGAADGDADESGVDDEGADEPGAADEGADEPADRPEATESN
jgi:nanoRNase/pAp phosphatase (c-di-AMP/oligoRNAs hydrolase)